MSIELQLVLTGEEAIAYVLWKHGVEDLPSIKKTEPAPAKKKAAPKKKVDKPPKVSWDNDVRPLLGGYHKALGGDAEAAKRIETEVEQTLGISADSLRDPLQDDLPVLKNFLEEQLQAQKDLDAIAKESGDE